MKKRIMILLLLLPALLALVLLWGYAENRSLFFNRITITDSRLPENFNGLRIAQLSDLHNAEFGEDNATLLALLESLQPDLIVCTGDMVDGSDPHPQRTLSLLERAAKIAPCYYVTGNHEPRLEDLKDFLRQLKEADVTVLQNEAIELQREDQRIRLLGMDDYSLFPRPTGWESIEAMLAKLETLPREGYEILLFHRPEVVPEMEELGIELILSGHAHGGQIRLPFLGGIIAPDQGFFPRFDAGVYDLGFGTLVLSRGLGNSGFPFRLNNPPEVLLLTLETP